MLRESRYPLIELDEALAIVRAALGPLPAERVALGEAAGRVLAEAVVAREAMPPFAAASVDGWAVVAADGPGERRVVGLVDAGGAAGAFVRPGTAARVATGAPIPAGADAVVMVEDSLPHGDGTDAVAIRRAPTPGDGVRPVGVDYPAGAELLAPGRPLGAAALGLAASAGAAEVAVYRRPRVAVFSSGDELVEPGEPLRPGAIRDGNRFALAAAAAEAGAEVVAVGTLRDRAEDLERLGAAVAGADAVVTSGGVSMGRLDLVKPWLEAHGRVAFGRVRVKPGKPVTFAHVGETPCFGLPGFPVSALVCFELFVRPALRRLGGHAEVERPVWPVRLAERVVHAPDRVELVRAVVSLGSDGPVARTTGAQGSGRLLGLAGANALLRLPDGRGATEAGERVAAMVLGPVHAARDAADGAGASGAGHGA